MRPELKSYLKYSLPAISLFILLFVLSFNDKFLPPALILVLIGGVISLLFVKKSQMELNQYCLLFFLFSLMSIVSGFASSNLSNSMDLLVRRLAIILIPILLYFNIYKSIDWQKGISVLVIGVFVSLSVILIRLGYELIFDEYFRNSFLISPLFSFQEYVNAIKHRTYLNTSFLLAIVFIISQINLDSSVWKYRSILAISFLSCIIFLTGARASTLVLFLILGVSIIANLRNKKSFLYLGVIVLIFIFFYFLLAKNDSRFNIPLLKNNYDLITLLNNGSRYTIWSNAIELLKCNWLFGVGLGDASERLVQVFQFTGFYEGVEAKFNCHNQYLELVLESGILSLIILILIFIFPFFRLADLQKRVNWLNVVIVFFVNFIFETYLNRIAGIMLFALLPVFFQMIRDRGEAEDTNTTVAGLMFRFSSKLAYSTFLLLLMIIMAYTKVWSKSSEKLIYANQPHEIVNILPGELPGSIPNGSKGYKLNNQAIATTGDGYAYSYTIIGNSNVEKGDSVFFDVWYYPSSDFNGDFVGLSYGGASKLKFNFIQQKEYLVEQWQKLSFGLRCESGKAPAYFYFAIKGNNFQKLKGNIIFTNPTYKIISSTK